MNDLGNTESSTGFLDKTLYYFLLLFFCLLMCLHIHHHIPLPKPLVFALEENTKSEIFFLFFSFLFFIEGKAKKNMGTENKKQIKYKKKVV